MGIILSLRRVLGWNTEDEARRPISPNHTHPFSTLFERLVTSFERLVERLLLSKLRKTAGPLLPLENPTPKPSDHPPLKQALLISNSDSDSDSDSDSQCQNIHVFSDQCLEQNQEGSSENKNTKDSVTISIPSVSSHFLDSYGTSSITDSVTDKNVSYEEHEETGIYISTGEIFEESSDRCLEQSQEYPSEVKNVVCSVTISIPNFSDHALDYSTISSANTDLTAIIQKNVPQKNESYSEHEKPRICISTEKKREESSEEKGSEGEKAIETTMVVEKGRWIKHYSSLHRMLLVGDGDFSFSCSLAVTFGCASKMVATSLDSKDFLKKHYAKAPWNIGELKKRGCLVLHGIDATAIATHHLLEHMTFDRIIFNFPHAGFFEGLPRWFSLGLHRRLVGLFLKNAKEMIDKDGEIHISHKTNGYHNEWKLVSMASSLGLRLIEEVAFDLSDYPGYNTKYGFGGDKNFDCYPSSTFKFGLKFVT